MLLREIQASFQARILSLTSGIESELNGTHAMDFASRLDAYVGGYRTRLVEALGTTYPVLKSALGDEAFMDQMRLYIDSRPSRHFSVRHYGADVAQHLRASIPSLRGSALADMARWEWTLADVFDAPDDVPLTVAALGAIQPTAWPTLCLKLRPCVRHFQTQSNVVEWWRGANGLCEMPRRLSAAAPSRWLLWRRGVTTLFRSLDPVEAAALDRAEAGMTFAAICEHVAEIVPESEAALKAASLLRGWIAEELIADTERSS